MRSFARNKIFPVSVCNKLIDNLDSRLLPAFHQAYPGHSVLHDLAATFQRARLPVILRAAQRAEDEVQSVQDIARGAVGHAFMSTAASATAYPSQAETTIARYKGPGTDVKNSEPPTHGVCILSCFGCGGNYPWMVNKVIMCPSKGDPQVAANAVINYKRWLNQKRGPSNSKRRRGGVNFDSLSDRERAKMTQKVLKYVANEHSANSSETTAISPGKATQKTGGPLILLFEALVLTQGASLRKTLPVPINPDFPHICLQLGTVVGCPSCPLLRCVVDTAAALTTGNFFYIAAVAKRFPQFLSKMYVPKDYSPITLSGIVQRGGASVTTELDVAFQFHLPYLTREGQQTTLLIATGPQVTVNLILGLPFIKATSMIIDVADQVAELKALDSPPFPIDFRRARVDIPNVDESAIQVNLASYKGVIEEIEKLESFVLQTTVCAANTPSVRFGAASTTHSVSDDATMAYVSNLASSTQLESGLAVPTPTMNSSDLDYHDPVLGLQDAKE